MRLWIMIFSAALFAGGTCLGVALQPKLTPKPPSPRISEGGWEGRHGEFSVTRFVSELGLSEEQDRQLDVILGETQADIAAYGRAMRQAHERSRDRVTAILTDEQKKTLEELMAAEREKRARAEADRKVAAYTKLLDLSEPQAKSLGQVLTDFRNRKRDSFSKRVHGGDHSQFRASFKSIREDQNKAIEKILSPEQFKRYLEMQELER